MLLPSQSVINIIAFILLGIRRMKLFDSFWQLATTRLEGPVVDKQKKSPIEILDSSMKIGVVAALVGTYSKNRSAELAIGINRPQNIRQFYQNDVFKIFSRSSQARNVCIQMGSNALFHLSAEQVFNSKGMVATIAAVGASYGTFKMSRQALINKGTEPKFILGRYQLVLYLGGFVFGDVFREFFYNELCLHAAELYQQYSAPAKIALTGCTSMAAGFISGAGNTIATRFYAAALCIHISAIPKRHVIRKELSMALSSCAHRSIGIGITFTTLVTMQILYQKVVSLLASHSEQSLFNSRNNDEGNDFSQMHHDLLSHLYFGSV